MDRNRPMGRVVVGLLCGLVLLSAAGAHAGDWYLYGGLGQADMSVTDKRGLWKHEGQPYSFDGKEMGFRSGLGATFMVGPLPMPLPQHLSLELGAVGLGEASIHSFWNHDEQYDRRGRCFTRCHEVNELRMWNSYLGGELVAKYGVTVLDFLTPYVTTGVAGFAHTHSGWIRRTWVPHDRPWHFDGDVGRHNLDGVLIAAVVGGGLCAKTGPVYLCGDVEKFVSVAHTANPLVDGMVLTTWQLRVPWSWLDGVRTW